MCLTNHFIDDNWTLHKRIINVFLLSVIVGNVLVGLLKISWGIKNVMTITVDNANSNDPAIQYLRRRISHWNSSVLGGDYLHISCDAHILNLIAKDGLKDLDVFIVKIHGAVSM